MAYTMDIEKYRDEKTKSFIADERSPLKSAKDLEGLDYYEFAKKYKINCKFSETQNAKPFDLPTYSGKTRPYIEYGNLTCPIEKNTIHLKLYRNLTYAQNPLYKNHLFLPFKDLTNGNDTYGGGRYIDITLAEIKDGKLDIDFNKCYNPWCAYSDGFNCPIPPKDNHLNIEILAGEKNYRGEHKVH